MPGLFADGERLKKLTGIPTSCHRFQAPVYAGLGGDLYLAYYTEPVEPDWDTHMAADPAGTMDRAPHAVARFRQVLHFSAEAYDDDTIREHRLAGIGLDPFAQAEVENSELVAQLLKRRDHSEIRLHRYPNPPRHFVFAVHGYVFEIVASGFELHREHGPLLTALDRFMSAA